MLIFLMIFSILFVCLVSGKYNDFVIRGIDKGKEGPLILMNPKVVRWTEFIGILLFVVPIVIFIFSYVKSIYLKNIVGVIIGSIVILILIVSNISITRKEKKLNRGGNNWRIWKKGIILNLFPHLNLLLPERQNK